MEYAVIESGGKQYKVSQGDIIEIDSINQKEGIVEFGKVLLMVSENSVDIGTPYIPDTKVIAKIQSQKKGDKIRVSTFKSKVRYRRVRGFRSHLTELQIEEIESSKPQSVEKKPQEKKGTKKTS